MEELEKARKGLNIKWADYKELRLMKASRRLIRFLKNIGILMSDWKPIINLMKKINEEELENGLRDDIMDHRMVVIERYEALRKSYHNKYGWKYSRKCCICYLRWHRDNKSPYEFRKVWKRLEDEKKGKYKESLARQGGVEVLRTHTNNKRKKLEIVNEEKLFKDYKDVFYKEKEKIKFCSIEKCYINTKRRAKVVKKGGNNTSSP